MGGKGRGGHGREGDEFFCCYDVRLLSSLGADLRTSLYWASMQ